MDKKRRETRAMRPAEREAVRTTIVGGRPPGSGKSVGEIPRGIEVLVKKAAVDPEFRTLLLEKRADAAGEIELRLTPSEVAMIEAVAREQLEAIIDRTEVSRESRAAFLGRAAALMLAALGAGSTACKTKPPATTGIAPDRPESTPELSPKPTARPTEEPAPEGIRPDRPESKRTPKRPENVSPTRGVHIDRPSKSPPKPTDIPRPAGIRPDPTPTGIRPDRP